MFESASRLWVVHISNNARLAERARNEGFMCIGWTKIGDLTPHDSREKMKAAYEAAFPTKSAAHVRSSYGQVFNFAHEMQVDEPVVYPIKGGRDIMIGRIDGDYEWSDDPELVDGDYCNIRKVEWVRRVPRVTFSQAALNSFGGFSSVATVDDHLDEVRQVLLGESVAETTTKDKPTVTSEADEETEDSEAEAQHAADQVNQATKDYLLRRWSRSKQDFEHVVAATFRSHGYTAQVGAGTHDLGVDVVAHRDLLGIEPPILKIQCKSGTSTVGAPEVKQLRGVLAPGTGEKGILISLGGFSKDALHTEQNDPNLILIDADRFVDMFLTGYASLSADMRHRFPLQQVYVVATLE